MNIVGINISHHSSSCLVRDGKLIYLLEEERISRTKAHTISYDDLRFYGLKNLKKHVKVIDHLVFASYSRGGKTTCAGTVFGNLNYINNNGWESFPKMHSKTLETYESIDGYSDLFLEDDRVIIHAILQQIQSAGIDVRNVIFETDDHHIHHAFAGYNHSDFDKAVVLVMDGGGAFRMGDYYTLSDSLKYQAIFREKESIYYINDQKTTPIFINYSRPWDVDRNEELLIQNKERFFTHTLSAGDLFNLITERFLGLGCGGTNSGKTMGLASHYNDEFPDELQEEWYCRMETEQGPILVSDPELISKLESLKLKYDFRVTDSNLYHPSMLAKKLQTETWKMTTFLMNKALEMTSTTNIILSGGYFMNCVNNYHYRKHFQIPDDKAVYNKTIDVGPKIFIDPIPYDAGAAFGCVSQLWLELTGKKVELPDNLYLGS